MRITIVMGFFLPVPARAGGATEKIWGRLGERMAQAGHDVTIVSRRWPGLPDHEKNGRLTFIRVQGWDHTRSLSRNLWLDFLWGRRVRKVLPPGDIVICNTVTLPIFVGRRRPEAGRVVVVLGRMPKGQVRAYGKVDLLLATSEAVADRARVEKPALASRIVRFANPIDWRLHHEASRQTATDTPLTIGYVGRIHPEKGLETLLAAGAELLRTSPSLPPWKIVLVGPTEVAQGGGGPDYLRALVEQDAPASGDRISVLPPCFDATSLAEVYGSLSIFCYPSRAAHGEGLSIAPLEAMAAGAVPVLSHLDCYRDVIKPGINGYQFDHTRSDAPHALAAVLSPLLTDGVLRMSIAREAQTTAHRYDFDSTVTDLLAHFARLTHSPQSR